MRNSALVREASLKASGADVHEVCNLLSAYEEACAIVANPDACDHPLREAFHGKSKALRKWAKKYERVCERSLRAYIAGVPARHVVRYSWKESRKVRTMRAIGKVAGRRLRRFSRGFWTG